MIDHPQVRNWTLCPLCRDQKDIGLVVCWPCHRKEKRRNHGAYSDAAETIIESLERFLGEQGYA